MIREFAPAKINLALHVTGRRADGYHLLDSITAFAATGDAVHVEKAAGFSLRADGPFAAGLPLDESNLALRAAREAVTRWPALFAPVRIRLEKNLPVASGIGGGSADAAAVLRAMTRLHDAAPPRDELMRLALELGADVPVCLQGRACRMRGIGEQLEPLADFPSLPAVLVNPGVAVSTAEVFAKLGLAPGGSGGAPLPGDPIPVRAADFTAWLAGARNDLQPPARALHADIGACLDALRACEDVRLARMSGSGATCFALFPGDDAARRAAARLRREHPRWWIRETTLGNIV